MLIVQGYSVHHLRGMRAYKNVPRIADRSDLKFGGERKRLQIYAR